jgi:hypothetical protein
VKWTNNAQLPAPIVEAIINDDYDYSKNPNAISVGQITDSPKIRILNNLHYDEMTADVSDSLWVLLGKAVHSVLQTVKKKNRLIEKRIEEQVDGFLVRGKPDFYDRKTGELYDYKITSVWSYVFGSRKAEWEKQLNLYAYLIRDKNHPIKKIQNHLILRDWTASKVTSENPDYPKVPFAIVNHRIWSDKECENYLYARLKLHKEASNKDPDELQCSDEERWARKDEWAVYKEADMKKEKKRAVRKFPSSDQAEYFISQNTDVKMVIVPRKGEDVRCQNYCSCANWCNYYRDRYGDGK